MVYLSLFLIIDFIFFIIITFQIIYINNILQNLKKINKKGGEKCPEQSN
nr:MAG TPA: hypothetical protein [Caudoviricetes sp.]